MKNALPIGLGAVALAAIGLVFHLEREPAVGLAPAPAPAPSAKRAAWTTPSPERVPAGFDRARTALWLRRQWVHAAPTEGEIVALAGALRLAGVTRVYPFVGGLDGRGVPGWRSLGVHTPYRLAAVGSFVARARASSPGLSILPWVGGVPGRDFQLEDAEVLNTFAAEVAKIAAAGADGVHVNMEPIANGDLRFLEVLRQVRAALPQGLTLSAAVVAPRSERIVVGAIKYWELAYLRALCGPADELVVMGYDTWLKDAGEYRALLAEWTELLAAELPAGECSWRMGLPTYDDELPHHPLDVERIDVALRGVNDGLRRAKAAGGFSGVALYASWTTDAQEWAAYDALWLGRAPTATIIPEPVR